MNVFVHLLQVGSSQEDLGRLVFPPQQQAVISYSIEVASALLCVDVLTKVLESPLPPSSKVVGLLLLFSSALLTPNVTLPKGVKELQVASAPISNQNW